MLDLIRLNDLKGLAEVVVPGRIKFGPGRFDRDLLAVDAGELCVLDLLEEGSAVLYWHPVLRGTIVDSSSCFSCN